MQTPRNQKTQKRALRVIFFVLLMDVIGVTVLYPVAPFLVKRYSDEALMVTLLTVIYAAAQFFAAPMLGKLGDRYGRRPVLLVSVFGSAIGYVIFGIGGALWILFFSRLIDGITAGNMSTASAYIADVSTPEERPKNFGLIGVAWGIGLVLGPAMGAVFGEIDLAAPAYIAAVLSFFSVALIFLFLPESLPKEQRENKPIRINDLNPFISIKTMAQLPNLGRLFLTLCLFNFAFNGINSIQTLFLIDKFSAQTWQLGVLLVVAGITVAVVQAVFVQRLVSRYRERPVGVWSLFGQTVSALAIFFAPTFWLIYPLTILNSALSTLTFPTIGTLASNSVSPRKQGILMGVNTALGSLMSILGPLWAGVIYDQIMLGAPYWMGAVVFVFAGLILSRQEHSTMKQVAA
jgi:DHA1 family tetracycline resistance protein-like MFS transporter